MNNILFILFLIISGTDFFIFLHISFQIHRQRRFAEYVVRSEGNIQRMRRKRLYLKERNKDNMNNFIQKYE